LSILLLKGEMKDEDKTKEQLMAEENMAGETSGLP
jgi:hypothetical protein